jgi:hypothetical protein
VSRKLRRPTQRQLTQVRRSVFFGEWCQDLIDCGLADVHQHIGVCKPFHRPDLVPLCLRDNTVQRLSTIILLQNLAVRHRRHPIVVEFEPPGVSVWFDESEVVPTVEVAGVNEDTVEVVLAGLGPVSRFVEEFVEVDFEGEFEAIVDLWGGVEFYWQLATGTKLRVP